ncbi:MAG: TRAP transporter substrate-binding protein DctP [Deltaproteobacteria bacterium]|nr:TRAP transporter substrate-binding protein DctP [Deltaproteobacteria bacterium]
MKRSNPITKGDEITTGSFRTLVMTCLFLFPFFVFSAPKNEIKVAFLAPDGSSWMNVMKAFGEELEKDTKNEVGFKMYPGGVLGDEKDVIRKMRYQIHAAGLTGMGMGEIVPSIRALELPFLFHNYEEVDFITSHMFDLYAEEYEKKGYILLGFAEAGFINIFSNEPIKTYDDMKKAKMWSWEGDPLAQAMFKAYNIVPVTMPVTDVLTSLQAKLVNSFYAPPLAAIALQWFTKVKYMTDTPVGFSVAGLLVTKIKFQSLPENHQKKLKELGKKYSRLLVEQIRKDNQKSYEVLKGKKIKFVKVTDEDMKSIRDTGIKMRNELVGKLYSQKILDKVTSLLKEVRSPKLEAKK